MPTAPYARALTSIDGGTATAGFRTPVSGGAVIAFSAESISGWTAARWELFGYPRDYATPSGWTLDAGGVLYSTSFTPTSITLPAAATTWGKWLGRLTVNNGVKNGQAGHADMVDETWGWEVLSPNLGMREIALGEQAQADGVRQWVDPLQRTIHAIEAGGANGQGYKAITTTDATVTTLQTYAMPDNSMVVIEAYAIAKKPTTTTCAFFAYRHAFYRSGGAPTAVGALEDMSSRPNGTAWALDIAASGNSILVRVTGQAATTIKWNTNVKALITTDTFV
jgi:hypothetical protein